MPLQQSTVLNQNPKHSYYHLALEARQKYVTKLTFKSKEKIYQSDCNQVNSNGSCPALNLNRIHCT
jgi:hypothetical protein